MSEQPNNLQPHRLDEGTRVYRGLGYWPEGLISTESQRKQLNPTTCESIAFLAIHSTVLGQAGSINTSRSRSVEVWRPRGSRCGCRLAGNEPVSSSNTYSHSHPPHWNGEVWRGYRSNTVKNLLNSFKQPMNTYAQQSAVVPMHICQCFGYVYEEGFGVNAQNHCFTLYPCQFFWILRGS